MDSAPTAGASGAAPKAEFFFSPNYGGRGPRVILLVGTGWRPAMRDHYGIRGDAFHARPAHPQEPRFYPNRHPWGWAFQPSNVLKYEAHWLSESELGALKAKMDACIAATPKEEMSQA